MPDFKDSAIKLFGKTISLPLNLLEDVSSASESCSGPPPACQASCYRNNTTSLQKTKSQEEQEGQEGNMETSRKVLTNYEQEDGTSNQVTEDSKDPTTSGVSQNSKILSVERETSSPESSKNGEQCDSSISQEKTLKKPDKILPCPRCNSMDTKFCYYNNYNVNQPRHFCKNCERYWTAGGTMRNVPVGAGRRKNKSSSALQYRHITVSEALRTVQAHALTGVHNPSLGNNSTVLTFGSDSPLCESVASVLSFSEKTRNGVQNGYQTPEQGILVSCGTAADYADDRSIGPSGPALNSSLTRSNGGSQEPEAIKRYQGFCPQLPRFPAPIRPYPWTSAMPPPTFGPSGFPVPFHQAPTYWSCKVPSPWSVPPCLSPTSSFLNDCAPISSPTSPLGKHPRDGKILNPACSEEPSRESKSSEKTVFVPKTLRIDDPSEAAKSSIWATLGVKSEKSNFINGEGLFKGFQLVSEDKKHLSETSTVLQANPAALSRSLNFHEAS